MTRAGFERQMVYRVTQGDNARAAVFMGEAPQQGLADLEGFAVVYFSSMGAEQVGRAERACVWRRRPHISREKMLDSMDEAMAEINDIGQVTMSVAGEVKADGSGPPSFWYRRGDPPGRHEQRPAGRPRSGATSRICGGRPGPWATRLRSKNRGPGLSWPLRVHGQVRASPGLHPDAPPDGERWKGLCRHIRDQGLRRFLSSGRSAARYSFLERAARELEPQLEDVAGMPVEVTIPRFNDG